MSDEHPSPGLPFSQALQRFEDACRNGERPRIEDYLHLVPEPDRLQLLRELLAVELAHCHAREETLLLDGYLQRFPEQVALVEAVFREAVSVAAKSPGQPCARCCDLHRSAAGPWNVRKTAGEPRSLQGHGHPR